MNHEPGLCTHSSITLLAQSSCGAATADYIWHAMDVARSA